MLAAQPHAKLFIADGALPAADYIPIFHRWIQDKRGDELLIDVHNYSHVPGGPGIILVAHQSYHCIDSADGRTGLWYRSRRGGPIDVAEGFRDALRKAIRAAQWLQADTEGAIRFSGAQVRLGLDDRLHAPNDEATHGQAEPLLRTLGATLFDGEVSLSRAADPRAGYAVELKSATEQSLSELAARLSPDQAS